MVDFSSVNLDSKLSKLFDNFKKHLDVSIKGFFVFLGLYAIKHYENIKDYLDKDFDSKGNQFRSETDKIYNPYIVLLVDKYIKEKSNSKIGELLNDPVLFKNNLEEFTSYVNAAGYYLIDNDLYAYKNNISERDVPSFIYDVLFIMKDLENEDMF